jgi:hypothetical protein
MSACLTNTMIKVGDTIKLHTQYVATSTIPDVMGIMGAWVYDNCPTMSNPTQSDILDDGYPGDGVGDDYGDACDADADGDGVCNAGVQGPGGYTCTGTDPDDDGDGYSDIDEAGAPLCASNVNDDNLDDTRVNDGCPASGAAETTCTGAADEDGDTLINDGCATNGSFGEGSFKIGTGALARCHAGSVTNPSPSWPSDFISGSTPDSTDVTNILDLTSLLAPTRRLDTSPGHPDFLMRYDLMPGKGTFTDWINITDLTALIAGDSGFPHMFGNGKAFNGPTCTGA